jgi:hypothetical protein
MICTAACSDPIPTSELRAEFRVASLVDRMLVQARFKSCEFVVATDSGTGYYTCTESSLLDSSDSLSVEIRGSRYWLAQKPGDRYEVELPDSLPGEVYTVVLERPNSEDAPRSTATLPPPFSFGGAPATASRAEDGIELDLELPVGWDPFIGETWLCGNYLAIGDADWQFDRTQNRLWMEPGTLERPAEAEGRPLECEVHVIVSLLSNGQLDPAFQAGFIDGEQSRVVSFTSVP